MMRISLISMFLFLIILIISYSCITEHKNFCLYKDSSCSDNTLLGVYICDTAIENAPKILILYKNGQALVSYLDITKNIKNKSTQENVKHELYSSGFNSGHYCIINDSVHLQIFREIHQYIVKYNSYDIYGTILDNNSITLKKEECDWCDKMNLFYYQNGIYSYNHEPVYKKTEKFLIPDPNTTIWFNNKKWYLKRKTND